MEIEELSKILNQSFDSGDKARFKEKAEQLLTQVSEEEAIELLSVYLFNKYQILIFKVNYLFQNISDLMIV